MARIQGCDPVLDHFIRVGADRAVEPETALKPIRADCVAAVACGAGAGLAPQDERVRNPDEQMPRPAGDFLFSGSEHPGKTNPHRNADSQNAKALANR